MSRSWASGSDSRWRAFRAALFHAWDQQGRTTCEVQLPGCTAMREQVDHIQPLSRGGAKFAVDNCRPSCSKCNRARGNKAPVPQPEPRPVSSW